ncbi:MAG TPA: choice-of-anchor tandem repeat GloVer-containing protein [Terriglobales bacterium]
MKSLLLTISFAIVTTLWSPVTQAQTFTVLHSFQFVPDAIDPQGGLIMDSLGNLFGTTLEGGTAFPRCAKGCGTVFTFSTDGHEQVLYSFNVTGSEGQFPNGPLVLDLSGNFYGTTIGDGGAGWGTIFKLDSSGIATTLHTFTNGFDGSSPYGGLIRDEIGNFYGTTCQGGRFYLGTIFRLDPAGKLQTMHAFKSLTDGYCPFGTLVRDPSGNLYGTTSGGGLYNYGTVFKLDNTGTKKLLHSFRGGANGQFPYAGLILDSNGNLYGTTAGSYEDSYGTVFKLDKRGKETVLYRFTGGADGAHPYGGLVRDPSGNLYGTTLDGASFYGTVFEISSRGKFRVLHTFTGSSDGAFPYASLLRDSLGVIYGTTSGGGDQWSGTLFKIAP